MDKKLDINDVFKNASITALSFLTVILFLVVISSGRSDRWDEGLEQRAQEHCTRKHGKDWYGFVINNRTILCTNTYKMYETPKVPPVLTETNMPKEEN